MRKINLGLLTASLLFVIIGLQRFVFNQDKSQLKKDLGQPTERPPIKILDSSVKQGDRTIAEVQLQKQIKWDSAERSLFLKRNKVEIINGKVILNLELKTIPVCHPGDADAIKMELEKTSEHKLLATVEELSGSGKSVSWDVPKDFLKSGLANHQFELQGTSQAKNYGFFLCIADPEDRSCSTKTTRDVNDILLDHIRRNPRAGKEPVNIFFQYFMLDERGITAFHDLQVSDETFSELTNYLAESKVDSKDIKKEVEMIKKNTQTLASFPVVFQGKQIRIELPEFNPSVCPEKGKGVDLDQK